MRRSKKEVDAIIKRSEVLKDLLKEFDARLVGFDPGVLATWETEDMGEMPGVSLDFTRAQWAWLEPLLIELRQFRKEESR